MTQLRKGVRALAERIPAFDVAAMCHGDSLTTGGRRAPCTCESTVTFPAGQEFTAVIYSPRPTVLT